MAKIDKRTKEYKDTQQSKGLGDTIEKVTKATGIKKAVELFSKATGIDCGCKERQEKLNRLYTYSKPNCFNEEQYNQWKEFKERKPKLIKQKDQELIIRMTKEILNASIAPCTSCSGAVWANWINKIDKVYETY